MKKFHFMFLGSILLSFSLIQCDNGSKKNDPKWPPNRLNPTNVKQIVYDWNNAHITKNVGEFDRLFDNEILYYGEEFNKNSCIESKLAFFKKNPDFYQQIYGDVDIAYLSNDIVKCSFVKRVTINQKSNDYPSYLTLKKTGEDWKIITESDLITDMNLAKRKVKKKVSSNLKDYYFEPSVSSISGIIKTRTFYGPPGYGENPESDTREEQYFLILDKTINVFSNNEEIEEGDFNETKYNVSEIQLIPNNEEEIMLFKNKFAKLTGFFFGAHTAHHHAEVLMDVQSIEAE